MARTKLIIFDCDGVLVDSELLANHIHAEALCSYGYPITGEESLKKFTGLSEQAVCQILLEAGIRLPLDYWEKQTPHVLKRYKTELNPLMHAVLPTLHTKNIARCVASNNLREHVVQALACTNQLSYFHDSTIFTSQQVQQGKPAPDLFLFAAREMGFEPQDCIVIEDSPVGITAALSAGMQVIGFLGGGHAQPSWYQEKIHTYQIPVANNDQDLLEKLHEALKHTDRAL